MAINKVVYGSTTLLDLTNDTVASEKMLQDTTAHGADGSAITGSIVNRGVINAIIDATDSNYRYALNSGYYKSGSVYVIREQKTVTPSASSFVVTPENGHVLSQVTVNAINSSYVGPNVVRRSSTDLSASGSIVTVPSGYYTNQVTKTIDGGTYKSDYSIAVTPGITINSSGLIQSYVNVTNVSIPVETSGYFNNTSSLHTVVRGASSKQLDVLAQTTYVPSSISQTIPSGIYLTGVQTITGDSNLIAENIAKDVTIFGITGTHEGGIDTSDATLNSGNQMLEGVTAYASDIKYTGTIPTKTSSDLSVSGAVVTVPSGYYATAASKAVAAAALESSIDLSTNPNISISTNGLITSYYTAGTSRTPVKTAGYITKNDKLWLIASGSSTYQLTVASAATYTPTTTDQTIAAGQYLTGAQTIAGDSNLIANNIKNGTTIFGVSGTFGPDDIMIIGDYGLCFNNFTITENTCTSEAGTVSGNTLIAV